MGDSPVGFFDSECPVAVFVSTRQQIIAHNE
jgi:hypothetical protein